MASTSLLLAAALLTLSFVHGQLQPGLEVAEDSSDVEPFLLFSAWSGIMRMFLNGSNPTEVLQDPHGISAIDYHYRRNMIYYLTDSPPSLMSHPLFPDQLASGQAKGRSRLRTIRMHRLAGIAVDWINDKVYWTDKNIRTVEMFDIATGDSSIIMHLRETPQGLSIFPYPNDTYLFVTTRVDTRLPISPQNSKLYKIKADGSEIIDLTSPSVDGSVFDTCATTSTIDHAKCKLSWINECGNMVEEAQLDGSSPHTLLEDVGHSAGLGQYKDDYYYTQRSDVYKNRRDSDEVSLYRKNGYTLQGLTVVHPSKQPEAGELLPIGECSNCEPGFQGLGCPDVNECNTNTHGCEQGCENTEGSYYCTCSPEFTLQEDQRSCLELPPTTVNPTTEEVTTPSTTPLATETSTQTPNTPAFITTLPPTTTSVMESTTLQTTTAPPTTIATESTTLQTTTAPPTTIATEATDPTTQPPTPMITDALTTKPSLVNTNTQTTGSGGNAIKTTALPEATQTPASEVPVDGLNSSPEGPTSGLLIVISVSVMLLLILIVASGSYLFLVLFKNYKKRRGSYNVRKRGGKRDSMDPLTRISYRPYVDYHPSSRPAADSRQSALMGSLSVESFERMSVASPFFVPSRPTSPGPSVQSDQPIQIIVTEAEIPPASMAQVVNLDLDPRIPSDTLRTVYSTDEREMYFSL